MFGRRSSSQTVVDPDQSGTGTELWSPAQATARQSVEQLLCCFVGLLVTQSYGFEQLKLAKIVAVVQPANVASQRVLEKCGLSYTGMGYFYKAGVKMYAVTRRLQAVEQGESWQ